MKQLTTRQVEKMMREQSVEIIDVREAFEVHFGTIPGSKNIPLAQIEQRLQEFNKKTTYIIICHSGSRSGAVANFLNAHGYDAYNMAGGLINWRGELE